MEKMNPHQLAEHRLQLSQEYSTYSGELALLIKKEAEHYIIHRPNCKSDTAVKKMWEVSEDGQKKTIIKLKLKALEKQMASIKTMIDVATEEARGLY